MLILLTFIFAFLLKSKKKSDNTADIDDDLITVNSFFVHWVKEVSITKYGSDKELPPTFSPWEVYQYSDQLLKHLPKDALKTLQKTLLFSKKTVYFASKSYDRRNYNSKDLTYTGLTTAETTAKKKKSCKSLKHR